MLIYNIGFINTEGKSDETQLDITESDAQEKQIELINLILSLQEEMNIKEIEYIDYVGTEEEE